MMQKPKGTYDLYGRDGHIWLYIINLLADLSTKYNYQYMRTPLFENKELFHRGVGETSDIVSKETYDFKDRSDRELTIRPEGTAGIVRSFIENKLYTEETLTSKFFYYGSMYRYERPQSGRNREFFQWGLEAFGSNDSKLDAEIISFTYSFFKLLGIDITVNINSIGDTVSRLNYKKVLVDYLKPHVKDFCEDCRKRYETNPLRILDCKVDNGNKILMDAPKVTDYLSDESQRHYEELKKALDILTIPYNENPRLVRGLDYYSESVFEFSVDVKELGSNNVLAAGGRYDYLVETLGGPKIPGVGIALGVDRIVEAIKLLNIDLNLNNDLDLYIIAVDDTAKDYAYKLCQELRMNGFKVDIDYLNKNLKGNLKQVDKLNPKYIIFVGEEEIQNNKVKIKDNKTFKEEVVASDEIITYLDKVL